MSFVECVTENPNSKSATFKVGCDLLGPFGKMAITKSGRLLAYSPLAQKVYAMGGDTNRVDLHAKDGHTTISIARRVMPWTPEDIAIAQTRLEEFFRSGQDAVSVAALRQGFRAIKSFNPEGSSVKKLVSQAFMDVVNPILAQDGGAMELLNVEVKGTGEIDSEVALIGSCNGCSQANATTLKKAADKIREVLGEIQQKYKENVDLQRLRFSDIRVCEIEELILTK